MNKCDAWGVIGFLGTLAFFLILAWGLIHYYVIVAFLLLSIAFIVAALIIGYTVREACKNSQS